MKTQMSPHGLVTPPKFKHQANNYGTGNQRRGFPLCEGFARGHLESGHASFHDQGAGNRRVFFL